MMQLEKHWYSARAPIWLLPLSWLFSGVVWLRRWFYRLGLFRSEAVSVPVIVVGNISVGGTGKTPLVIWLVKLLRKAGYKPGIISRGYGGQAQRWPQQVRSDSDPVMVGDEPVLLAQRCECPVVAAPDRVTAAKSLLQYSDCDILIADDGLQHYRLKRQLEIIVIDGERRFGNGHCLPAGPLREPTSRLEEADYLVANGLAGRGEFAMTLLPAELNALASDQHQPLAALHGQQVHAVAAIGNPKRFFNLLTLHGLNVIEHPFPDHHVFTKGDVSFSDELPILMTEKDAVKCRRFGNSKMWSLPIEARLDETFAVRLLQQLKTLF